MSTASIRSFDKYKAYSASVQCPSEDVRFMRVVYRNLNTRDPRVLREDFCGTFANCCEWVKLGEEKRAIGLDIDPEPIAYGKENYLSTLTENQQDRVAIFEKNVLERNAPKADIICAFNFSYFCFHDREMLRRYFESVRRSLLQGGLFMVDVFGGSESAGPCVGRKRLPGLTYFFEQEDFDPINNRAKFHIHFQPKGGRKRKSAFTYDWRLWTIPEIRDVMKDAGFNETLVYWEGTARNGRGSGKYHQRDKGESCQVWVAYIVGRV